MIVFCEECGERYIIEHEIDPVKGLEFKCTKCDEMVRAVPPQAELIKKVEKWS